jgi:hypothetical protein
VAVLLVSVLVAAVQRDRGTTVGHQQLAARAAAVVEPVVSEETEGSMPAKVLLMGATVARARTPASQALQIPTLEEVAAWGLTLVNLLRVQLTQVMVAVERPELMGTAPLAVPASSSYAISSKGD